MTDIGTPAGLDTGAPLPSPSPARLRALALGAIGVVFGDIGTSPLYTLRECFTPHGGMPLTPDTILGVLSLLFWALIVVVTMKYVIFIMRADNHGEGGILALSALALRGVRPGSRRARAVVALGVLGAALFYGDSFITPAISVLSAVEGLGIATPLLDGVVKPIALVILTLLFLVQKHGAGSVGRLFGPVMLVWFALLGLLGLKGILAHPQVLGALLPSHALHLLATQGWTGFTLLGAVVLAITGGEALYADMGHFGRLPIRLAWFGLALPTLLLNYFGQGALLIGNPAALDSPFFHLAPDWALLPMVLLATMATVIASQAVISGAFSMTQQAIHLGWLPRLRIRHTSADQRGQVYLPAVNWGLLAGVVALVEGFGSSSALAGAYGIAVTGTMLTTTILAYVVARRLGRWSLARAGLALAVFASVDVAFLGSNLLKIVEGGWVPLAIAAALSLVMITWRHGRARLLQRIAAESMPLDLLLKRLQAKTMERVPGNAVYLSRSTRGLPHALLHNLKHNKVLHQRVVLLTVLTDAVPYVPPERRFELTPYPGGFFRLVMHYGFKDEVNIPEALMARRVPGLSFDMMDTSFFISRETLILSPHAKRERWCAPLFLALSTLSLGATQFFGLPPNRVVELGIQVEI